ncbi:DNA-binding protein [Actinomadura sp. KC216]|uniref:helix-turn-helix transcriptional regulator n=1 Tax=Actinomadura sp. KC216 TaxID=2530370 RepID=UPI00104EA3DB|nr:helix-turn-helix domain-containing protein [Actinomadura sp. KC216]TDB85591.1 DNA-binding protein [Actinomadura sp. KC216]
MTSLIYPPQWWITVPEICDALRVTPPEMANWASRGRAPAAETCPDGIQRIRRTEYDAWIDSMAEDTPESEGTDR